VTLLLDTHAFLWFCQDAALKSTTAKESTDSLSRVRDSPVSRRNLPFQSCSISRLEASPSTQKRSYLGLPCRFASTGHERYN